MRQSASLLLLSVTIVLTACQEITTPERRILPQSVSPLVTNVTITDLGTLGGPTSDAEAVNEVGQIVGFSHTAGGQLHPFLWQNGTMTDLGTLGGSSVIDYPPPLGVAVNRFGQVVGTSYTVGDQLYHAFLWQNGAMVDLGALPGLGRDLSSASAINDLGQVTGWSTTTAVFDGDVLGAIRPFLWQAGTMANLGAPDNSGNGSDVARGLVLNAVGQVGGIANLEWEGPAFQGVLWRNGTIVGLGTLGGNQSRVVAMNDLGQVVGSAEVSGGDRHAFLWQNGNMRDLHPNECCSESLDVNNLGQVIGDGPGGAFLWQNGVMTILEPAGHAAAINDLGQIVGSGPTANGEEGHAILWQNGTRTDLGTLGGSFSQAVAINNRGQIVGVSMTTSGDKHAVLWTVTMPGGETGSLASTIDALVAANLLKSQNAGPLLNILTNVQKKVDRGDYAGAADVLEFQFIPKVQASMPSKLPTAVGQSLIDAALGLIGYLRTL